MSESISQMEGPAGRMNSKGVGASPGRGRVINVPPGLDPGGHLSLCTRCPESWASNPLV